MAPYHEDCNILGFTLGSPILGNYHIYSRNLCPAIRFSAYPALRTAGAMESHGADFILLPYGSFNFIFHFFELILHQPIIILYTTRI